VLDHVHPEKLPRQHLDGALKCQKNREEAEPECGATPSPVRNVAFPRKADASDQIKDGRELDADEDGGLERPGREHP
jgi:hypothetical protein